MTKGALPLAVRGRLREVHKPAAGSTPVARSARRTRTSKDATLASRACAVAIANPSARLMFRPRWRAASRAIDAVGATRRMPSAASAPIADRRSQGRLALGGLDERLGVVDERQQ